MAHFAKIENGVVTQVIVVGNENINHLDFPESEEKGRQFIASIGLPGTWLQASYNRSFRKNFPGTGYTYDALIDAFVSPKPYPSWTLNKDAQWAPPVPYPDSSNDYQWDEIANNWVKNK
jgi:hypothetical protein